jgi:hypothetical protein
MVMKRILTALALGLVLAAPATAQTPAPAPPQATVIINPPTAEETRESLRAILQLYPYSVGEILRRDPSLMVRADYMTAYPRLAEFVAQHPEVARNVEYYFEGFGSYQDGFRRRPSPNFEALGVLLGGMAGVFALTMFLTVIVWLVRAVIQHRRWLRASSIQADVHTKLMERMTTNEELLAYVQSPAGRRFLDAAPLRPEADSGAGSAPVGPIIWSMMAGIVLAVVGAGFRYSASFVVDDAHQAFVVVGVIIIALGTGFILASLMAFLVSSRLGLFPQKAAPESQSTNA